MATASTPSPTSPGRRERRKLETRRRLLDAARALLVEQGSAELRIGAVTERADIGFGTLYTYFASRDELLEAVVADVLEEVADASGPAVADPDADPAETAAFAYRRFFRLPIDAPEVARALVALPDADQVVGHAVAEMGRGTLERGAAAGRFAVGDVELTLSSLAAAALAAIRGVLDGRVPASAEADGTAMVLRGLGLTREEAAELARRPLPALEPA